MNESTKKRKYISVSLDVKIRTLDELQKGMSISQLCNELNVCKSTIISWRANEKELREWKKNEDFKKGRKRLKKPLNETVDKMTWMWFKNCRRAGCALTGPLIQTQAKRFWQLYDGVDEFEASTGWLSKWKERHGIRCLKVCGEKLSADLSNAETYHDAFLKLVDNLTADQIFNADESGLNFKQTPRITLSAKNFDEAIGFKIQKERITIMACSNASGSLKLPLVVLGKSMKPRAIKNLTKLPVWYRGQKNAWMTAAIFEEWFNQEFVPKVKTFSSAKGLPLKAILFVDNCGSHPKHLKNGDIRVEFLPANTTSLLQPMDQGVLQNLKSKYRASLMFHILNHLPSEVNMIEILKKVSIREVINWVDDAWTNLPTMTIVKSWKKLWPEFVDAYERVRGYVVTCSNAYNAEVEAARLVLSNEIINAFTDKNTELQAGVDELTEWLNPNNINIDDEMMTDENMIDFMKESEEYDSNYEENDIVDADSKDNQNYFDNLMAVEATSKENIEQSIDTVIDYVKRNAYCSTNDLKSLFNIKHIIKEDLNKEM